MARGKGNPRRTVSLRAERWDAQKTFRIAGQAYDHFDVLVMRLEHDGHVGQGESLGVDYLGESIDSMIAQIEQLREEIESGMDREELQEALPPGGARCAVDCALWDLQAKESGMSVFERVGVTRESLPTVLTLGVEEDPSELAAAATSELAKRHSILKLKVDARDPVVMIQAIRAVRPDAAIIVDANQSWTIELLRETAPDLTRLGISMLEQPLPRGADQGLEGFQSDFLVCADESCQDRSDLETLLGRYGAINIKLDKSGGLTEALHMVDSIRQSGLSLMVGNMCGTSLSMAPGFVIGQYCDFVDLDGPLLNKLDREPAMRYRDGRVFAPSPRLWG